MAKEIKKFKVTGMSCAACSSRVDKAVSTLPGVEECSVNLLLGTMQVTTDISDDEIVAAVNAAGYGAYVDIPEDNGATDEKDTALRGFIIRLVSSSVLLIALMYFSMGHMMLSLPLPAFMEKNIIIAALTQAVLSLAIMLINSHFFINGAKGLVKLSPNMDTLVALGSFASFAYSAVLVALMPSGDAMELYHGLYFESAAMILVLIGVGKMLEHIAKGKTTSAILALMDLSPKTALVRKGTEWVQISARDIKKGDIFLVRRGENIATDGRIIAGECSVDESSLTGESLPLDKERGYNVYGGTTVLSGYAEVEATGVGEETVIAGIVRTVKEAAGSKAPIAKLADKVSGVFVPVVMLIALISTVVWLAVGEQIGFALARGVCVLVISCPCALGLATPVSIMVGSGVGARMGILYKTAGALERTAAVKVIAFDKTGTVTEGDPHVEELICYGPDNRELIDTVYALELASEHPLAAALVAYAREVGVTRELTASSLTQSFGGLSALIEGEWVFGGNVSFIEKRGIKLSSEVLADYERLSSLGRTVLLFARGGSVIGIASVTDRIKSDSSEAVSELHRMGISSVMITGDNEICAKEIAREVGIDRVVAGVFPEAKAEEIKSLKASGDTVAMVGDGVNDAPALTVADVGIAIGRGTDIAIDSADIVLVKSSLTGVADAIKLSRRTLRTIKQNLFWAFFYNVIGIPLAAGVFIPLFGWSLDPMFGAAAMSVSSFLVVTNALLLNLFRPKSAACECSVNESAARESELTSSELFAIPPSSAEDDFTESNVNNEKGENTMNVTIKIEGMMCPHCSGRVKKALLGVEGVISADVSHERGDAVVEISEKADVSALRRAVEDAGYTVLN